VKDEIVVNTSDEKTCFIISQIGELNSPERQQADEFLHYIVKECEGIRKYNYEVIRADEISTPGRITTQIVRLIDNADLVIADVSGENVNVYYELALRHALNKPVIICAKNNTKLPFDTRDNRTIFYDMHIGNAVRAREELSKQIDNINTEHFVADNPISEAGIIITLRESGNPDLAKTGLILERLDDIAGTLGRLEEKAVNEGRAGRAISEALARGTLSHSGIGILAEASDLVHSAQAKLVQGSTIKATASKN
jgi:hypothetical protein